MNIEKLKYSDLDFLHNLDKNSFLKFWDIKNLSEEILNPNSFNFGVFEQSNFNNEKFLKAAILGRIIFDEYWIFKIMTHSNFRRSGLAGKLIQKLITTLKTERKICAKSIWLEVSVQNRGAIQFYQKNGFQIITKRLKYYPEDAFIMCLMLK